MLVWDSLEAHITEDIKPNFRGKNTIFSVILAGCTGFCQLADFSWNASFKAFCRDHYAKWISSDAVKRTSLGNLRPMTKLTLIDLVKKSQDFSMPDVIRHYFGACGITSYNVDEIDYTERDCEAEELCADLLDWVPDCVSNTILFH